MLSIDVLGPYPETRLKNKYVLIVTDVFSKWTEARAYPAVSGKTVVDFLEDEIILRYGPPKTIISDNGSIFKGVTLTNWCEKQHIDQRFSPIYHQQANPTERRVQELKKTLRTLMLGKQQNTWDKHLTKALYVLRTRSNAATGMTPAKAILGYELPKNGEWDVPQYQKSRAAPAPKPKRRVRQIYARQLQYQTKYAHPDAAPEVTFAVGDRVLVKILQKSKRAFDPVWTGPHPIVRCISNEVYEVDRDGHLSILHVDHLRPAPAGNEEPQVDTESEYDQSDETDESAESSSDDDDDHPEPRPTADEQLEGEPPTAVEQPQREQPMVKEQFKGQPPPDEPVAGTSGYAAREQQTPEQHTMKPPSLARRTAPFPGSPRRRRRAWTVVVDEAPMPSQRVSQTIEELQEQARGPSPGSIQALNTLPAAPGLSVQVRRKTVPIQDEPQDHAPTLGHSVQCCVSKLAKDAKPVLTRIFYRQKPVPT